MCIRNGAEFRLLLERGDLVRLRGNVENQVCKRSQCHDQRAAHLRQKRTHGRDDRFVSVSRLQLVVLDRVHDGDHHDEVESVQTQVDDHVADRHDNEAEGIRRHNNAAEHFDHTADDDHDHAEGHQLLSCKSARKRRINKHQNRRRRDADHREDGIQAALIAVAEVNEA